MLKSPITRVLALAFLITGAWYLWTPRRAWDHFLTAVVMADQDALQRQTDFVALRTNLRADLEAGLQRRNERTSLGQQIATGLLDEAVGATLTPRGLANLITAFGTRTPQPGDVEDLNSRSITSFRYRSPSRVEVRITTSGEDAGPAGVVTLTRSGLSWRVTRISSERLTDR